MNKIRKVLAYFTFFILIVFLGCKKSERADIRNLKKFKNSLKTSTHNCTKPVIDFVETSKSIKLIYQRVGCRIDTFSVNPQMKLGDLMDSLKRYFDISIEPLLYHYTKNNKFITKDYIIITPTILPKYAFWQYKMHESHFGTALANSINRRKAKFIGNKYPKDDYMQSFRVSAEGTYFKDNTFYKNSLVSFLDSFSNERISLDVYMKNGNFIDNKTVFHYSEGVKLSKYNICMISTRNKTLSELGLKNFDIVHYFSVSFILD